MVQAVIITIKPLREWFISRDIKVKLYVGTSMYFDIKRREGKEKKVNRKSLIRRGPSRHFKLRKLYAKVQGWSWEGTPVLKYSCYSLVSSFTYQLVGEHQKPKSS